MRSACVGGGELTKLKLVRDVAHPAKVNPHAITAMTRLIIGFPPRAASVPKIPLTVAAIRKQWAWWSRATDE